MKYILIVLLAFISIGCFAQNWFVNTKNKSEWTRLGINSKDIVLDTSYHCRIIADSKTITIIRGRHTSIFVYDKVGVPEPWWDVPKEGITYATTEGMFIYYPNGTSKDKRKRVIRYWPSQMKIEYF